MVIPYSISYTIIVTLIIMVTIIYEESSLRKGMPSARELYNYSGNSLFDIIVVVSIFKSDDLQSFLPLAILSVPLAIVTYGVLTGAQLGFSSLPQTVSVWFCNIVQAGVQLRYVMQSNSSSSSESSRVSVARTDLSRRS
ncbi:hypothetical protein PRIPAC_80382 [Pristionchus pacificus]|uniref:Uncharacterized protein n=1 Tax=Pristionchus pacificus TaxID=54126 RepID=A0A2A6CPL8_PRIPA|nr:hypothetical protein PRIPAC_80382 [Pristionchus pacificus]|eukprot:PDM80134.1 hypothetical protein PRIPAC_32713 [Pristionchus pacificus]